MNASERQLAQDRATRDAARAVFDARLAGLRQGVGEKSIGARIGDEALGRALAASEQALAVARESRWVVVGTITAVAAWFLREPLMNGGSAMLDYLRSGEPASRWRRLREWAVQKVKK